VNIRLPEKKKRGGQKTGADEKQIRQLRILAEDLKEVQKGMNFHMSARGWCYVMEPFGLAKGDFESLGQPWIRKCRVLGFLEPGFIKEEESHEVEGQSDESETVEDFVEGQYNMWQEAEDYYTESWNLYDGISFWEDKNCYIQLLVEKVDLKYLFARLCKKYRIPAANLHGWGSLEQKAVMAKNFQYHENEGRQPILFACSDFDPPGLEISNELKGDFEEFSIFTGWRPYNLEVERIGLGYNFIQDNHLIWVENLKSSNPKKPAMNDPKSDVWKKNTYHIREYVAKYGARKCEANAIVVVPKLGEKMFQDYIDKWLGENAYKDYEEALEAGQSMAKELIERR